MKPIVTLLPRLGTTLFLALALLLGSGCRKSTPPPIEICILDGFGGADCIEPDGSKLYRTPSMLKDYWSTNEVDQSKFASWCYNTNPANVDRVMSDLKDTARVR